MKKTVVIVEPNKTPRVAEIDGTLEAMQEIVGGLIEACYYFEDEVALICNEEGKIRDLPPNRVIHMDGQAVDIVAGTFFIIGAPEDSDEFESLTEDQVNKYTQMYKYPEVFVSDFSF